MLRSVLCHAPLILLLTTCETRPCAVRWTHNVTELWIEPNQSTPNGVLIDDPGSELDLLEVDRITAQVTECVQWAQKLDSNLCVDEPALGAKLAGCMVVKVPDWHVSECTGEQVFSCAVPAASCAVKGQTGPCPCSCRGAIQDGYTMLITPNRKLYAGTLTQYLSGCWYVWAGELERCASIQ